MTWLRILRHSAARLARRLPQQDIRFVGDYADWSQAQQASEGYAADRIADHVLQAAIKTKNEEAAYERDGVIFAEVQHSFPVLAALLLAALTEKQRLRVLDFGGAFGSSYVQNRGLLQHLEEFTWGIVEQGTFVARGRVHLESSALRFYPTIEECVDAIDPNFVLLSSVLSYLPDPLEVLGRLATEAPPFICLDRSLVAVEGKSRLTVQVVPPQIYEASYPCWILREDELLAPLRGRYRRAYDFKALGGELSLDGLKAAFKGYLFVRTDVADAIGIPHPHW
jgi:putative methyltransferase (TIGR04325 family)